MELEKTRLLVRIKTEAGRIEVLVDMALEERDRNNHLGFRSLLHQAGISTGTVSGLIEAFLLFEVVSKKAQAFLEGQGE